MNCETIVRLSVGQILVTYLWLQGVIGAHSSESERIIGGNSVGGSKKNVYMDYSDDVVSLFHSFNTDRRSFKNQYPQQQYK